MSGEMDVHPVSFDFDFEDLKDTEGYNPPDDFLIRVLPLHAGGALPPGKQKKDKLWYEYRSPFGKDWNLQSTQVQLELGEREERRKLEEREELWQKFEDDMHWRGFVEREERQKQNWNLQCQEEVELQFEEAVLRLSLEENQRQRHPQQLDVHDKCRQRLDAIHQQRLHAMQQRFVDAHQHGLQIQRHHPESYLDPMQLERLEREGKWHRLWQEHDDLYVDEIRASSSNKCWGSDDKAPTHSSSSSPARDVSEEHQFQVEEHKFYVEEHQVQVQMWENDATNIPRCRLFNCEANTQELLLGFPLKIPYYIYAGRCNLNVEGYQLRYAELFPDFYIWSCSWVRPTTYEGDNQYVDFWSELLEEAEYTNSKDRLLAKAIAIANKGFQKMLYFQIELAVEDCRMLLEHREKMEQTCNLYGYIATEIYFKKQKYESVLERILNGHVVLRYELTLLGNDPNEDDALEMRDFVSESMLIVPMLNKFFFCVALC
jgi:hypothetical protein